MSSLPVKFYSPEEVAEMFAVKAETIRDWIAKGKFPGAIKIDARWRIPEHAIRALANGEV